MTERGPEWEDLRRVMLKANGCGVGDTGPDGKWRAIFCNDESLEGDRGYYNADCECAAALKAILDHQRALAEKAEG